MLDSHIHPDNWGIRPILFSIGNIGIPSYAFFVALGLIVGLCIYFYESKKQKKMNDNGIFIVVGALLGGALGAKILGFIVNFDYLIANINNPAAFLSGRTIVGGFIGGVIGAILTKRILKINENRGNFFAPAIAIGVAIGRLGCFFVGCCYGKATNLPWGVDFGDHISRHPTQLYESLFMLLMFIYLEKIKNRKDIMPGQLLKILMMSYFIFRFLIDFIKVEPAIFAGLTIFQIISFVAVVFIARDDIKKLFIKLKDKKQYVNESK